MTIIFAGCDATQKDSWEEDDFNPATRNIQHDSIRNGDQNDAQHDKGNRTEGSNSNNPNN